MWHFGMVTVSSLGGVPMLEKITAELQAQIASTVAGTGLVWAAKVWTSSRLGMRALVNTPGLVELLCVGILLWLVAKWRSVTQSRLSPANSVFTNPYAESSDGNQRA